MSWFIVADVYVLSRFPNKNRHFGQQRISVFTMNDEKGKLIYRICNSCILIFNLCIFYLQIHPIKSLNGYPRLNKLALNTNIFIFCRSQWVIRCKFGLGTFDTDTGSQGLVPRSYLLSIRSDLLSMRVETFDKMIMY